MDLSNVPNIVLHTVAFCRVCREPFVVLSFSKFLESSSFGEDIGHEERHSSETSYSGLLQTKFKSSYCLTGLSLVM